MKSKSYKLIIFFIVICTVFLFNKCNREAVQEEVTNPEMHQEITKENYQKYTSKLLRKFITALNNKDFLKKIKEETFYKRDGDYEVLVKEFSRKQLSANATATVGEFLVKSAPNLKSARPIDGDLTQSDVDTIGFLIPNLQIGLRGAIESWDGVQPPLVVVLPWDFNEKTTEYVDAYDKDGNVTKLEVKAKEYNFPVIVIARSERYDRSGKLKSAYAKVAKLKSAGENDPGGGTTPPPTPTQNSAPKNFKAVFNVNVVTLTWEASVPAGSSYEIKRNKDGEFITIAVVSGSARMYIDSQVGPNSYCAYSIRATGTYDWNYAEVVTSAALSSTGLSLKVINPTNNRMFLRWSAPNETRAGFRVYRWIIDSDDVDWVLLGTLPATKYDYIDANVNRYGKKYWYKVVPYYADGSEGTHAAYDVSYCSYRKNNQPLYLQELHIPDISDVESLLNGKPEFELTATTIDPNGATIALVPAGTTLACSERHTVYTLNHPITTGWDNDWNKSIINIFLLENDDALGHGSEYTLNSGFATKDTLAGDVIMSNSGGGTYKFGYRSEDEVCGEARIPYWHYLPTTDVNLPTTKHYELRTFSYGIWMTMSTVPWGEQPVL